MFDVEINDGSMMTKELLELIEKIKEYEIPNYKGVLILTKREWLIERAAGRCEFSDGELESNFITGSGLSKIGRYGYDNVHMVVNQRNSA